MSKETYYMTAKETYRKRPIIEKGIRIDGGMT